MTKFLIASAAVAFSLALVLLSVDKPNLITELVPLTSIKTAERAQQVEPALDVAQATGKAKSYPKLQARNIFSADGAYAQSAEQKPLGDASLTLLGVIGGKTKKAIFRDSTGAIIAAGEGEPFLGGAVISRIERLSVTVNRGEETKEFVIFDMKSNSRRGS